MKFVFTSDRLSVQVHPNDEFAAEARKAPGKTEMWYVLRAEPGARIAIGFRESIIANVCAKPPSAARSNTC